MKRCFSSFVIVLLLVTGCLKALTALINLAGTHSLSYSDPLILFLFDVKIPEYLILLLQGPFEIYFAIILMKMEWANKLPLIAVLSSAFLVYHAALAGIGYSGPCPCFGNAYEWIHLSPHSTNMISVALSLLIFVLSYGFLTMRFFESQNSLDNQMLS